MSWVESLDQRIKNRSRQDKKCEFVTLDSPQDLPSKYRREAVEEQYQIRAEATSLKIMNFNGFETLVSKELGVAPYFSSNLRYRVRHKLACNIVVTGEPGISKSITAMNMARVNEGVKASGKERFSIDQVVFRFSEYMNLILRLRMGKGIMFDEPSYAMGKRDWFKEVNKVLVQTIESQRFLVHPLWIPIINQALLDKTIRAYLIQFRVQMVGRGHGIAYRIHASQSAEKIYQYQICELFYRQFDREECDKDSCLDCKKLDRGCQIFRAQYERKKASIQLERYAQAKTGASKKEAKEYTTDQLIEIVLPSLGELLNRRGRIDPHKLILLLKDSRGIEISPYKAYNMKRLMEIQHKEEIENA